MASARYVQIPMGPPEDENQPSLLLNSHDAYAPPKTQLCSLPLNILLRIISNACAVSAFVICIARFDLVGKDYIACDVFLGIIMIYNSFAILGHLLSKSFNLIKITVEFKDKETQSGKNILAYVELAYFDLAMAFGLAVSLVVGNSCTGSRRSDPYHHRYSDGQFTSLQIVGSLLAYIVLLLQAIEASPFFNEIEVSLNTTRSGYGESLLERDVKFLRGPGLLPSGSAEPPSARNESPRQRGDRMV